MPFVLRRLAVRLARVIATVPRNMLGPQFRGYKPLNRLASSQLALTRPSTLAILAVFAILVTCWHFFGLMSRERIPASPAQSGSRLPKYWSVTGKGSLEGVTDFKKPENMSVVALVFYGRPPTVSILDCYLKVRDASWNTNGRVLMCCRETL